MIDMMIALILNCLSSSLLMLFMPVNCIIACLDGDDIDG